MNILFDNVIKINLGKWLRVVSSLHLPSWLPIDQWEPEFQFSSNKTMLDHKTGEKGTEQRRPLPREDNAEMLLDYKDPIMVKSNVIESDEEETIQILDKRKNQTISEYDSESSSENEDAISTGECSDKDLDLSIIVPEIREVWNYNLYDAFSQICRLVGDYPFVAMDTEFPGIVAKPIGNFSTMDEYKYQLVKCNVDLLKMIQLGMTLFDGEGNRPPGVCTWQFNFKFSLNDDLYAEDSIDLLVNSGIQFEQHSTEGIEPVAFAEMLLSSGLVLMDNVTWLTFHSAYDFGYLLSQLTCQQLPESETEFLETLRLYFPNMYDIKYLMASTDNLNGGLQKVANELRVKRIGSQHQAGSDSLLTGEVFFKMYQDYFSEGLDDMKYNGYICGLGAGAPNSTSTPSKIHRELFDETVCMELSELHVSIATSPVRNH